MVSNLDMRSRAVAQVAVLSLGITAGVVAAHLWADRAYRSGRHSGAKMASECVIGGSVRQGERLTATEESINWCGDHATD